MKKIVVILIVFCCSLGLTAQADSSGKDDGTTGGKPEQKPEYPGGYKALNKFIADNLVYPIQALADSIQGTVQVSFIVDKNGAISKVTIIKGLNNECDNEAIRVIKLMPNWIPAKPNGHIVAEKIVIPIKFKLK